MRPPFLCALGILLVTSAAHATGHDFVDDVLVAKGMEGELGIELASDSRVDRDYRLQCWFTSEVEGGITRGWVVEGVASLVNRGRGLEFAAWKAESRYVLAEQPRWPVALAGAVEYEVEERPAKHPSLERLLGLRVIATRTFAGSVLTTVNWGWDRRLVPIKGHATMHGFGVRYPESGSITYGFEYRRQSLEGVTRFGPEIRMVLPRKMLLRLGGSFGRQPGPYRFIGRAVIEVDL